MRETKAGYGRERRVAPLAAGLLLTVALAACGDDPSAPSTESIETELARLDSDVLALDGGQTDLPGDVAGFLGAPDRDRPPVRSRSLLVALTHRAIRAVAAEEGREAAHELLQPVFEALREARRAREAGEPELAREYLLEARLAMAQIVVRVLGPQVSERVLSGVGARVDHLFARLEEAEANGEEHPRVRALLERASALLEESAAALEAGDPALSLERSTRAADLLHHWIDG